MNIKDSIKKYIVMQIMISAIYLLLLFASINFFKGDHNEVIRNIFYLFTGINIGVCLIEK